MSGFMEFLEESAAGDRLQYLQKMTYFDQIMLGEPRPNCGTCRFFAGASCRIRSPSGPFPFRAPDDWCGEHKLSHPEIKHRVTQAAKTAGDLASE